MVYQYSFKRAQRDNRAINAMIERAEKVAAGTRAAEEGPVPQGHRRHQAESTRTLVDRARQLAGLKGYVTNIARRRPWTGAAVIAAYHDLWQVEQSFRMTKSDLRARPVFHHQRESIEAHLTIVFAALAISPPPAGRHRHLASRSSSRRYAHGSSATIDIDGHASPSTPTSPPQPAKSSSGSTG